MGKWFASQSLGKLFGTTEPFCVNKQNGLIRAADHRYCEVVTDLEAAMPILFIPAPLRELAEGQTQITLPGNTFGELLDQFDHRYPGVKNRLCVGDGLIPGFQVSVNDVLTKQGLRTRLEPTSEVHILPVIGGG